MPSAREVGLAEDLLDQVLIARPDLREPLHALLQRPLDDADAWLAELGADDPAGYGVLLVTVAGGYYLHKDVRERIGFVPSAAAVRADRYPAYVADGLLDHMMSDESATPVDVTMGTERGAR
jgi:hypothetical protein